MDLIVGRNATFLGPVEGVASDSARMREGAGEREVRFNVNFGYYF